MTSHTKLLHDTIKDFVEASRQQTDKLIRLTWAIVFLTIVMAIGLGVQIYLTLWPSQSN
jgi:hypothetical protein